jgi:hypothetical protein
MGVKGLDGHKDAPWWQQGAAPAKNYVVDID